MDSKLRVPPHSKEAERSVLGSVLLDRDAVVAVVEFLRPEHFYEDRHQKIFRAVIDLYQNREPVDVITVSEKLNGELDYLKELVNSVPTASHASTYGHLVKDNYTKRTLIQAAGNLMDMGFDESQDIKQILDSAESQVFSLSQQHLSQVFIPVKDILAQSFDRLDELHKSAGSLRGVATGFIDLDDTLAGMQDSNLLILAARPGIGKCVTGNTLIIDPRTGERKKIIDLVSSKKGEILALNADLKLEPVSPANFVDDGVKPVYEMKTNLGNKLEATAIHPLLTISGWKSLEKLEIGEKIAVPRKLECFGNNSWPDWQIKSLAYFMGDGSLTNTTPRFSNTNPRLLFEFTKSVRKFGNVVVKLEKQSEIRKRTPTLVVKNKDQYRATQRKTFALHIKKWIKLNKWSQKQLATHVGVSPALVSLWVAGKSLPGLQTSKKIEGLFGTRPIVVDRINPVTKWLEQIGIMGKLSVDKEIPSEVLTLNKTSLSIFLNRLYACEGCVMLNRVKGAGRISFASSSSILAEQVKHLLLRFGIVARLREKNIRYRGNFKRAFEVEILNSQDITTFATEIGIFGKEAKLIKLVKKAKSTITQKNWIKDTLPREIWKLVLKEKGDLAWREIYARMGRPLSHNIHVYRRNLRRETLKEIALALDSTILLKFAESDIYWDRIVSIKAIGERPVFDLVVRDLHNFVANDIIVHNTALALNICRNAAFGQKLPVGFFSLEMSKEELMDRLLVAQADIDAWKLKTGHLEEDEFTKLSDAMGELYDTPLYIDDTPGMSILEMRTKARRLQAEHGLKLIVVDYLQLARPSRNMDNRVQEVSEISQGLKNLARELKIPVLALSQLSRQVEQRGIKKPQLADLRECLAGDTLITKADTGESYSIKDLVGKSGFKVFSLGDDLKLKISSVRTAIVSGKKKIYTLATQSGRNIRCSNNHPFYTLSGWRELINIKPNDYIAIPRHVPQTTIARPKLLNTAAKIRLLGHMLGDGGFIPRRILQYTSINQENLKQVSKDAKDSFKVKIRITKERTWYQVYFTSERRVSKNYRNPMVQWLDDLGIWGLRSPQRFVPKEVFMLPLEDIRVFLRHIWATDGCVWINQNQTRISIYYASASRILAGNIQSLLLRCGILSNIHVNKKKGYKDGYHVCVESREMQLKFADDIGGFADRFAKIQKVKSILANIKSNPNLDIIPKQAWTIIDRVRKFKKITWRRFAKLLHMSYCGSSLFKSGISRERMIRIASFLDDQDIWNLADSGIYWDKILSITSGKTEEVYDLQVEGTHNFVANDIYVHNSGAIEQDADVVMFMWREDEESVENMTLDIAKHRNGPLRSIKLRFRGDRIRFYSVEGKRRE